VHPIEHLRYVARAQGADPASLVEETAHALGSMRFDPAGLVVACRRVVERHPFTGPLWWLCSTVTTSAEPFEAVWELADEIRRDPTARELAANLPDDATIVTIGDPQLVGEGLVRRGDVRVLAFDADHTASSFLRRLERHDVDIEPVDAGVAGAVIRHADVVLVEALAVDQERAIVPIGSSTVAAIAFASATPVWLVAGLGRRLPATYLDAMVARIDRLVDGGSDPWELEVEVLPLSLVTDVVGPVGRVPMGPPAIVAECGVAYELLRQSPI
jgi:translation initiation factor 2B subunit (eIF-2B alpha/beta/delta family)